jgi:uncharacterized protein YfaS (alpha-2-macroglobulin family)
MFQVLALPVNPLGTVGFIGGVVSITLTGCEVVLFGCSASTDPNTHVDIVDKDGNIIGSGTTDEQGHVTITPNPVY